MIEKRNGKNIRHNEESAMKRTVDLRKQENRKRDEVKDEGKEDMIEERRTDNREKRLIRKKSAITKYYRK